MILIDDSDVIYGVFSSVCTFCRHLKQGRSCAAFDDIPAEIWTGTNDHRQPYPGDNGIQFEPIDEAEPQTAEPQ